MSQIKIDPFEFEYLKTLEEEGIKFDDLPLEIRRKINGTKPTLAKYNKTGNSNYHKMLQKLDVEISKMILDHIEENLPEEDDDNGKGKDDKTPPAQSAPAANNTPPAQNQTPHQTAQNGGQAQTTPPTDNNPPATPPADEEPGAKEAKEVKEKIAAYKEKHGEELIPTEDLAKIIGKRPADPYQTVGKLKLKKVYLRPFYRIV